mgnify:CR=1 FL=1
MVEGKVVSLKGNTLPQPGQPSEKFVAFLEEQLQRAKSAETIGFAGAIIERDLSATYWIAGHTGGFSMVGALQCALQKLAAIASGD